MNPYYLTFDIVCDEIESRVYDALSSLTDYSICDVLPQLVDSFVLDYPEEAAAYGVAVIESVFGMKAEAAMCGASLVSEPDYLAFEDMYFSEGVQLTLFV